MFDVERFIGACRAALQESSPQLAIKEVVERAMSQPRTKWKMLRGLSRRQTSVGASSRRSARFRRYALTMAAGHVALSLVGLWRGQLRVGRQISDPGRALEERRK
jgi:hypothetical protein